MWCMLEPNLGSRSYVPPVKIGETMRAGGIGTIVKGNETFKEGDVVEGVLGQLEFVNHSLMMMLMMSLHFAGWAEYVVVAAKGLRKLS